MTEKIDLEISQNPRNTQIILKIFDIEISVIHLPWKDQIFQMIILYCHENFSDSIVSITLSRSCC